MTRLGGGTSASITSVVSSMNMGQYGHSDNTKQQQPSSQVHSIDTTPTQDNQANHTVIVEYDLESPISPVDENEPIDFSLVYALHTFVANLEGQVCVLKGDALELLDDSNSYWWLVKCLKTEEIGYIPAENIETPFERLARLNRQRNVKIAQPNYHDMDPERISFKPGLKKLAFAPEPLIIYEDGEMEGGYYMDDPEYVPSSPGTDEDYRWKLDSAKIHRTSGISKVIKNTFVKKFLGKSKKEYQETSQDSEVEQSVETLPAIDPINVLRIYAGNIDLKATFKTVAIQNDMTGADLLAAALKRFRTEEANPNEYYLSYLHMDSQEKRIAENERILDLLEGLRHKSLPGLGELGKISHAVMKQGRVSSVKMNDDNIVKILINKKLNLFEKNYHLMRVFMKDDSEMAASRYKTMGVDGDATIGAIIQMAKKKFKIPPRDGYRYYLYSVFNRQEIKRTDDEIIRNVLQIAKGSVEDIDFILAREYVGQMAEELESLEASQSTDPNESILNKPSFLQDTSNPPDEPVQTIRMEKPDTTVERSSIANRHSTSLINNPNIPIRARGDSLTYSESIKMAPSKVAPLQYSSDTNSPRLSSNNGQPYQTTDSRTSVNKFAAPPRQGSLKTSSSNQALLHLKNNMTKELAEISRKNSDRATSRSSKSSTNSQRRVSQTKKNFEHMEDYLEEMIKGNSNGDKVAYLENVLNVNNSPTSQKSSQLDSSPGSGYNDGGLSKLVRPGSSTLTRRSLSPRKKRPVSMASSQSGTHSLKSVYDELEADLELSLKSSPKQMATTTNVSLMPPVLEVGVKSTRLSKGIESETDLFSSLQQDLDNILNSAVKVYNVSV